MYSTKSPVMKKAPISFIQKVNAAIKAYFDKNPNDLIALSFGILVFAFIFLITPQIPQKSTSTLADQPEAVQETVNQENTDLDDNSIKNDKKVVLKATLK
jgi:hypothetical protein